MVYGFHEYKLQGILLRTQNFYMTIVHTHKYRTYTQISHIHTKIFIWLSYIHTNRKNYKVLKTKHPK